MSALHLRFRVLSGAVYGGQRGAVLRVLQTVSHAARLDCLPLLVLFVAGSWCGSVAMVDLGLALSIWGLGITIS